MTVLPSPLAPANYVQESLPVLRRLHKQQLVTAPQMTKSITQTFQFDEARKIAYLGVVLELSRTEYRLLEVMVDKLGRVFIREELKEKAWEHPDLLTGKTF